MVEAGALAQIRHLHMGLGGQWGLLRTGRSPEGWPEPARSEAFHSLCLGKARSCRLPPQLGPLSSRLIGLSLVSFVFALCVCRVGRKVC